MTFHSVDLPIQALDLFGPGARYHHTGLVTASIESVCGAGVAVDDPIQRVRVAFVRIHDQLLELVEPWDAQSPVALSLQKGVKLLHLCYSVPDLSESLRRCRAHGFLPISKPQPAVALGGRPIVWVMSTLYGLFELLEEKT
ncbi:MAG: VOC family protein [Magnetococcales bacterium]|nr:VOC family protein [Magnetococcales bacterium]